MVDLSVVIVSWNTRELLRGCLWSVVSCQSSSSMMPKTDNCKLKTEIIIVDNASTDGSAAMIRAEFPATTLIVNTENVGFARANNQGIRASSGRYVVLLNSDTVVPPGALAALVAFMDAHPAAGAVGPRLLRPDGAPQPYAFGGDPTLGYLLRRGINRLLLRRPLHDWTTDAVQTVDWVSGACLMVRREAIDQAGLLDENIFMYFEDNDWCLRIRQAGWQVYYDPQVAITHIGGQSVARNPAARRAYRASLRYFYARHYGPAANLALQLLLPVYARLVA
jgi:GT2 family glycosyltransferase